MGNIGLQAVRDWSSVASRWGWSRGSRDVSRDLVHVISDLLLYISNIPATNTTGHHAVKG